MDVSRQRIVVVGLGLSGRAAAELAVHHGAASVAAMDTREHLATPEGVERVPFSALSLDGADLVVVSPGVAAADPVVQAALARGVPVEGEPSFAARWLEGVPLIAITGTNGKSTVTHLTGQLLGAPDDPTVFVGGNLGTPLSVAAKGGDWRVLVLEVSSYQLELPHRLKPAAAVILNLTPDHLARHGSLEAYGRAKAQLLVNQQEDDVAFVPRGGLLADLCDGVGAGRRLALGGLPGVRRTDRAASVRWTCGPQVELDLSGVTLQGAHNLDHAATAAALALAVGEPADDVLARLPELTALDHRMQSVHTAADVVWIDDSKATNVAATSVAVAGLDRAAVVLLGGEAKDGDDITELAAHLRRHRAVVTFGASGDAFAQALAGAGVDTVRATSLDDAVARARGLAQPGDAVLLSPACASFDAFTDFAHRGRAFAALARQETP